MLNVTDENYAVARRHWCQRVSILTCAQLYSVHLNQAVCVKVLPPTGQISHNICTVLLSIEVLMEVKGSDHSNKE